MNCLPPFFLKEDNILTDKKEHDVCYAQIQNIHIFVGLFIPSSALLVFIKHLLCAIHWAIHLVTTLFHLSFRATLCGGHYYPYLIEKKTKA